MSKYSIQETKGFSHSFLLSIVILGGIIGLVGLRVGLIVNRPETESTPVVVNETDESQIVDDAKSVQSPPSTPPAPVVQPQTKATPKPAAKPSVSFTTPIKIKGDAACNSTTLEALKLLSTHAPSHYAVVTSYISVIECATQGSGMFAYENPPRYLVGDVTRNVGAVWYASTIAHDAGHARQYRNFVVNNAGQPVPDSVWTGEAAERACLEAQYDALTKIGGTTVQLTHVKNIINSQYYNVPYGQRWW